MTSCRYEILMGESDDQVLTIRDLGPWDRHKTITNDVESVIDDLWPGVLRGRRLFYYDTRGELAEILYAFESGRFLGFNCTPLASSPEEVPVVIEWFDNLEGVR